MFLMFRITESFNQELCWDVGSKCTTYIF